MKKMMIRGLAAVALCAPLSVMAQAYVGAGVGVSTVSYSDTSNGTAFQVLAGYDFANSPYFVEAAYADSGDMDIDDGYGLYDSAFSFTLWQVTGGAALRFAGGSSLYAKAGIYSAKSKAAGGYSDGYYYGDYTLSEDTTSATWSLGGEWRLNPVFGIRAEASGYAKLEDFADKKTASLLMVNGVFHFGA